jgi:hypothetical protein
MIEGTWQMTRTRLQTDAGKTRFAEETLRRDSVFVSEGPS